ncbi:OmpA family protein [Alteriqipengyuania lutimaris]|uniref:OmpA family protein n=1 Tax=Alteriqipengyuania lutimaris TaxID=1538146 RepID=A0A395LGW1_9SPHN|nr:OmpA family protein [Alteriqipengyuania lutimaris]MBB3035462.1 outer membrane protein OmpA-like peptidoglycan-associated protein [Alteriqipengyuania lutimaris]RDS76033.1 OmpA family protein [Alteriqipengyuania lutimaris]
MNTISNSTRAALVCGIAALALPASGSAQEQWEDAPAETTAENTLTVTGAFPADISGLPDGPEIDGFISAQADDRIQVTSEDGTQTVVFVANATEIKSRGGFLGLGRTSLDDSQLFNGVPVTVRTVQWDQGLIAQRISMKESDLKTAAMIQRGTQQGFAEQTAATEALRGRVADIDNYNVKGTTNVYFDTGEYALSGQAQSQLCGAAAQADAMDNALLLVVGYTDSTGSYEINQELSEKRAERVVNYLQQQCGWKPYRMLTPTGMAQADPVADNSTDYGKQQNRRVAVNILVSKAVDGM